MTHTEILNRLAEKFGYKRYLEIGVQNPENNFNLIKCPEKWGVDPVRAPDEVKYDGNFYPFESNTFFRLLPSQTDQNFDLIFIDGLHHWEQAVVDIINALNVLAKDGTIVVHDLLPTSKEMQDVPRAAKEWTGDVWRAWIYVNECTFSSFNRKYIIDCDYGVGIMEKFHGRSISAISHFCSENGIIPPYNEKIMDEYRSDYVIQPDEFKPLNI